MPARCPRCYAAIPSEAPQALCPKCVLAISKGEPEFLVIKAGGPFRFRRHPRTSDPSPPI
jgi:hypothetical protein